jgi:hypothetical protein
MPPRTSSPLPPALTAFHNPNIFGFHDLGASLEPEIVETSVGGALPLPGTAWLHLAWRQNGVFKPTGIESEESAESVDTAGLHPEKWEISKTVLPRCYRYERQLAEKVKAKREKIKENATSFQDVTENKGSYGKGPYIFKKLSL